MAMTFLFAFMLATFEWLIAYFVALPSAVFAAALPNLITTDTGLLTFFIARWTFVWLMARFVTNVDAARKLSLTLKTMMKCIEACAAVEKTFRRFVTFTFRPHCHEFCEHRIVFGFD